MAMMRTRPRARRRQPEKVEQQHVVQLLRSIGCRVWVTGVHRRTGDYQGTMMTPGLPDVIAFLPRALGVLFVEVKAEGGRLRPEQAEFRKLAIDVEFAGGRVYHVVGGLDAVIVRLVAMGLVREDAVPHYRIEASVLNGRQIIDGRTATKRTRRGSRSAVRQGLGSTS